MVHFHIFCELKAFSELEKFLGGVWISKFWGGRQRERIEFSGGRSNLGGNYGLVSYVVITSGHVIFWLSGRNQPVNVYGDPGSRSLFNILAMKCLKVSSRIYPSFWIRTFLSSFQITVCSSPTKMLTFLPSSKITTRFVGILLLFLKADYREPQYCSLVFKSWRIMAVVVRTRLESLCNQHRQSVSLSGCRSIRRGSHISHH